MSGCDSVLNIFDTGIMGYITIPKIDVELPIYHGTDDETLNLGAGHMKGSSLPVGGTGTHAVIGAHRDYPSAKMFRNLDQMEVGNEFTITVFDQVLTYRVEKIKVVLPAQMETLALIPGKDYVTLMTCTPLGSNSHRLLLRSCRVEMNSVQAAMLTADSIPLDPMPAVFIIAATFVIILICFRILNSKRRIMIPYENTLSVLES